MSFAKHHFRKEKNVTRVSRRVFFCVCVGLRQNRAAEMQQPLQIFLLAGWQRRAGAKPRWRKTTKRRIRLALEPPQIFSPPPPPPSIPSFSFLFSPSLRPPVPWHGVCFARGLTRFGNIRTRPWIYQCLYFAMIWWRWRGETWHLKQCRF